MKPASSSAITSATCAGPCTDCALASMGTSLSPRPSLRVVRTAVRVFCLPLGCTLLGVALLGASPALQPFGAAAGFWLGARLAALGGGGRWV